MKTLMLDNRPLTRLLGVTLAALVLATGFAAAQSGTPSYGIVEIGAFGTPGAETWSDAYAINERGEVVGMAEKDVIVEGPDGTFGRYQLHGFLYRNGELIDLGSLASEYPNAVANDINNQGQTAGWSMAWSENPKLPTWFARPTAWAPDGGIVDPASGGPAVSGTAEAINDLGQMALNLVHEDPAPNWGSRAHFWDPEDGLTEIAFPDAPAPGTWEAESDVYDINNAGIVVGSAPRADGQPHAFKYDSATGSMQDLNILGAIRGAAFGVNDRGDVAGRLDFLYWPPIAMAWTPDGNFVAFADQLPGTFYGWAQRINNHGDVVGTDAGQMSVPWVSFDALEQLSPQKTPLAELLSDEDRAAWVLWDVRDINDAGQIVGVGIRDGKFRGFLMTPAAPAAIGQQPPTGPGSGSLPLDLVGAGYSAKTLDRR